MIQLLPQKRISFKTPSPVGSQRPEIDLLLCCARTYIDTATAAQIQHLLQTELDWAYLNTARLRKIGGKNRENMFS